ncbi:MAG TPA: hypothetical protein EYP23_01210 [Thermoplasmata archaeon]|nr:hypothetical protein [Thermoplasmata archaeon]
MRKTALIAIGVFLLLVTQVGVVLTSTSVSEPDLNLSSTDIEDFFDSNEKTLSDDDVVDYDQDYEDDDNFQGNEHEIYDEYTDVDDIKKTPPVAVFDYSPSDPKAGDLVVFDGRRSYDADGKIVQYKWSYTTVGVSHYPISMGDMGNNKVFLG